MTDKSFVALTKIIGERMQEARELLQFTRSTASDLLGCAIAELTNIEHCVDVETIHVLVIYKAAQAYDVSMDFLFGLSDDWERDPVVSQQRQFGAMVHDWHKNQLSALAVGMATKQRQQDVLAYSVKNLIHGIDEINEAFLIFKEMNYFDDLPAGSKLQYNIGNAVTHCNQAKRKLVRCKAISKQFLPEVQNG
jgi:transcriptional regulator with XRE-family HTH domain